MMMRLLADVSHLTGSADAELTRRSRSRNDRPVYRAGVARVSYRALRVPDSEMMKDDQGEVG